VQLELADNKISGSELSKLSVFKDTLTVLKLSNNKITSLDQVKALNALTNLTQLELVENEVASINNYRDTIYEALPGV